MAVGAPEPEPAPLREPDLSIDVEGKEAGDDNG
jgi:hypothetical protein